MLLMPLVAIGGEVDALAVAREDRVDVVRLAALHAPPLAGGEVDREELGVVADHRAEHQDVAVGRERRRSVEDRVLGHVLDLERLDVEQEEIEDAVGVAGERDVLAVRAPRRRHLLLDRHVDDAPDAAVEDVDDDQRATRLALAGEHRERVAVGRERDVAAHAVAQRQVLRQQVLELGRAALGEIAQHAPLLRVEQDQVDVVLDRRERRHQVARRRRDRRELLRAAAAAVGVGAERPAEVAGLAGLDQLRQVLLAQPAPELGVEVLGVDAERALDGAADARAQRVPELVEEVAQAVLAPAVLDEVERGVAVAIGEEAAALRLGDRRQHVVDRGVDQEHAVVGGLVLTVVARHAFHEPLRRRRGERLAEAAGEQDVVLEDVGQLVTDERVELGVGQVDRHHHAEEVGRSRTRPRLPG